MHTMYGKDLKYKQPKLIKSFNKLENKEKHSSCVYHGEDSTIFLISFFMLG